MRVDPTDGAPGESGRSRWSGWLIRLRLDDVLALLFTSALLFLGGSTGAGSLQPTLRYFLLLMAWYGGVWWGASSLFKARPHSPWLAAGVLVVVLSFLAGLTLSGDEGISLENIKNFVVLAFPILLATGLGLSRHRRRVGQEGAGGGLAPGTLARDFLPFLISEGCYLLLHDLVHLLSPVDRDGWLLWADQRLLGGHLTVWLEPLVRPWAVEWFSATYSLFLFFPLTLGLYLGARGRRVGLLHLLQAVVLTNYLGYIGYLLVPAVGPLYTLSYQVPLHGGWFYQVKEALDALARVPRDCFPSLHTANTLVVLLMVRRYAPRLGWVYYPLGISCIAATVYLRYHYTVDVLAGLGLGWGVVRAVPGLARGWEMLSQKMAGRGARHA